METLGYVGVAFGWVAVLVLAWKQAGESSTKSQGMSTKISRRGA